MVSITMHISLYTNPHTPIAAITPGSKQYDAKAVFALPESLKSTHYRHSSTAPEAGLQVWYFKSEGFVLMNEWINVFRKGLV